MDEDGVRINSSQMLQIRPCEWNMEHCCLQVATICGNSGGVFWSNAFARHTSESICDTRQQEA